VRELRRPSFPRFLGSRGPPTFRLVDGSAALPACLLLSPSVERGGRGGGGGRHVMQPESAWIGLNFGSCCCCDMHEVNREEDTTHKYIRPHPPSSPMVLRCISLGRSFAQLFACRHGSTQRATNTHITTREHPRNRTERDGDELFPKQGMEAV
jgi:hypothetical protein